MDTLCRWCCRLVQDSRLFEELPRLALSAKPTLTSALFVAFNPCKIVPARAISIPGRDTSLCARSNTFMSSATATP